MIKYTRYFITLLLAIIVFQAGAQQSTTATTSSPYSRYGLGNINSQASTQNIGMGGLSVATPALMSGYFNINTVNPATYAGIGLTVIDIGLYGNIDNLSQSGQTTQTNRNFRIDHVNFAFPISRRSAISFGLQPYSELGYNYKTSQKNFGTGSAIDTNAVNYIYSGNGGLSKAYFGYGFGIGKHLTLGANVSYIFGKLQNYASTEIPSLFGTLNSRVENTYSMGGANYDFGGQYSIDLTDSKHVILGYSASSSSNINSQYTYVVSQYNYDASGNENIALDTVQYVKNPKSKIKIPMINHFGLTYVQDGKYLIGAEYTQANWSQFSIGGENQGLQNSKTYNFGGQITPDINALSNYWSTIDYRAGFMYNQSYIPPFTNTTTGGTTNITSYAVTLGLGLPLRSNDGSFYKINFAAEIGKRGTLENNLVKENYVNLHLSFMLNDKWFKKYKLQ